MKNIKIENRKSPLGGWLLSCRTRMSEAGRSIGSRMGIVVLLMMIISLKMSAQQQPLHTMFMFNKLLVNPAYAGY
ncbi:MAG: type IX secretion system membrane protein PorP/SprF, partial [Saprospiraceae bacterium]